MLLFFLLPLPEQSLEILRQLCTPSVTRVHGDKYPDRGHQTDILSLEVEPLLLVLDGILDTLDLNCHHRQHLHRDPVELIEAAPGPRLCQTFVDVPNRLEYHQRESILSQRIDYSSEQNNCCILQD